MKPAPQTAHPPAGAPSWSASGAATLERARAAPEAQAVGLIVDRAGVVTWAHAGIGAHAAFEAAACLGRPIWEVLAQPGRALESGLQLALRERLGLGGAFRLSLAATPSSWAADLDASPLDDQFLLCLCLPRAAAASAAMPLDERSAPRSGIDERAVLRALTDNLPISVVALSLPDLAVVSVNRHALEEFSPGLRPALPAPIDAVLGAGMQRMLEPSLRRAVQARQAIEHDFVWPVPGHDSVVSARHVAVRGADGTPQILVTQLRDITDRRRAEIDLLESELRFKELVEAIDDGVFVTTPGRERMHYFARRLCELYSLAEDEARRDPTVFQRRIHVEDRPLVAQARERELRFEPTDLVFRIQHPESGQRWLRQRTRTRMLPSGELRVYGVVADVTEEREQAMQLQAARDVAEAASQAKSQFMANMSHEIRTPMNGILGMTELLLGTTLNDRQRRFAQAVYRSGESLLEIINDILDFAKIESGRLELAAADFSPRSVVEDTLELLAPRAHEKGLELSFREAPDVPAVVHCDPLRLRQVLTNLVANAIKFTEHGEVTIDLRCVAPAGGGASLEFRVRDTGIGISREMMPQLFRAFMQGHGGMARRYGGTGLGLAISRQLVELMGGEISVSSAPGIGSEFRFNVRIDEAAPRDEVPPEATDMPRLRVLVVDDNPNNRIVLDNLLSAWGMQVTLAGDGLEALVLLRAQSPSDPPFDLALVDWHMPGLDGIGFARALRAEGLQGDMKLMLLSSLGVPDDARIAHDNGFSRFIPKPVRKADLRQAILGLAAPGSEPEAVRIRFDCHVLVIEDNAVNQEVMQQMLKRLGCHVSMAASAMDGLRLLTERRYDLVLMDIQMPGMDGVEALQWLRGRRGQRFDFMTPSDVPVVAVTANALDGDEERFLDLGFDDYVSKPFRQSRLVALLNRFLSDIAHERSGLTAPAPFDDEIMPAATGRFARTTTTGEEQVIPMMTVQGDRTSSLDQDALDKLRELDPSGSNNLMERVLKAYDSSVSRLVPQLEEAAGRGDLDGVRHVAHTLKSSSASIGARVLSQMCAETEAAIREQRALADLPARVTALRREIECVQRDLHRVLAPADGESAHPPAA